jgi:acyl carrier protein
VQEALGKRTEQAQVTSYEKTAKPGQPGGITLTAERNAAKEIEGQLRRFINDNFMSPGVKGSLKDDTSLLEEGIVDSTGVLNLVMFIEETFGIQVKDEELVPENLDSLNKIVAFVEKKTGRAR